MSLWVHKQVLLCQYLPSSVWGRTVFHSKLLALLCTFLRKRTVVSFTHSLSSDAGKTLFKILNHKLFLRCHICAMGFILICLILLKLYISSPFAYRMTSLDVPPITSWLPLHDQFVSPEFLLWPCFLFCLALLIEPSPTKSFKLEYLHHIYHWYYQKILA